MTIRTVLVTGVSRGLGLAIAARLLADGYRVVGASRTESDEWKELAARYPETAIFQALDMSDLDAISDVSRALIKTHGSFWALVNNAGIGTDGVLGTMHKHDIEKLVATNLLGPIFLTKYMMRAMLARRSGRIVNISSIIASTGFHGLSVYAATKAGLEGFTRSLSREAGKLKITVNCVAPGYMETEMTMSLQGDKLESVRRRAPLGLPTPEQVATAVSYLLSDDAAAITGTVLTVDGGSTA
ncbi:SDR family NAD(P)-dependent oxidoreductase [Sandaracinobacteroides hominis]|uniref:SDR family NAD(P)-dependent oxidoreductase n=1 Tax=Sandaracinobacteroides hominis TaxID=2780086 RepID=UPI0018F65DC7|nr:SDR family NAD(P)-dependent oxidoreductase [Sandaracinobacteroides hominis]